jgi:flavin-dependent dehydrogenase
MNSPINQIYYLKVYLQNYEDNELDVRIYNEYHDDIGILIEQFHKEHTWDKMYTVEDTYQRFTDGMICMVWYWENAPIGLIWYYPIENYVYSLNVFVSNKRPNGKTIQFFYKTNYLLKTLGYDFRIGYNDDWNGKMKTITHQQKDVELITKEEFDKLTESVKKYTYIQ